jgi:hypothetical protein
MIYQDNQDQTSGAEAAERGRETAPKIATALGLEKVFDIGNEFRDKDGKLLSIRCARRKNSKFGLVHTMRDRIDYVISAYVNEVGKADLYKISVDMWIKRSPRHFPVRWSLLKSSCSCKPLFSKIRIKSWTASRRHLSSSVIVLAVTQSVM